MKGPNDSYVSGRKRQYRREIWNVIESMPAVRRKPVSERRVLVLDEWKAEETKFLVRRGYRPTNITAVNIKVGTAARITLSLRRDGIEGVTAKSGEVGMLWERLSNQGVQFDIVHLDFCGNLSSLIADTLESFNGIAATGPTAIAVNILSGRESNALYQSAVDSIRRMGGTTDDARRIQLAGVLTAVAYEDRMICRQHLCCASSGRYISTSGQPMLWFAGELRSHGDALADPGHVEHLRRVLALRHAPDVCPVEWWTVPYCVKSLGVGGHVSIRDGIDALVGTAIPGSELKIVFSQEQQALMNSILQRKLQSNFGTKLATLVAKDTSDPRRQIPERYLDGD